MIRRARNLGESDPVQTSYRRRTKKTTVGQKCHSCNTTDTPEWRRGPDGARTLCNACGLHYSKLLKRNTLTIKQANPYQSALPSPPPLRIIELQQSRHKRIAGMGLGEPHQ
ncbi:GATA zinc finger-domain-containing protein [Syncephalastrum racemosum]|uniref:GATA zinc finger-domain-containing protein n=1 Tax=Syncephalastrum racemosum TaxID=13706 RepID=A0A1X2HPJ2_SYNRA|nr:GATA zinc finger-domain-containing protein [Syncephalastrum racemosum]